MSTDWTAIKDKLANVDVIVRFTQQALAEVYEFSAKRAFADETRRLVRDDHGVEVVVWGEPRRQPQVGPMALHASLHVRCAFRFNGDAGLRVDCTIERPWVDATDSETYDVTIDVVHEPKHAGDTGSHQTLLDRKRIVHGKWQRKRFVAWVGKPSPAIGAFDRLAWQRDGRIPNYIHDLRIDPHTIDDLLHRWDAAPKDGWAGDIGLWTAYEKSTGARDEIGLLPAWCAAALVSHDSRLLRMVVENDRLFGSAPIFVRDRATNLPISIVDHPDLTFAPVTNAPIWWDGAHHPSVGYVSALLTGDLADWETTAFVANAGLIFKRSADRNGAIGDVIHHEQERARAWKCRSLLCATKGDVMQPYFDKILRNNMKLLEVEVQQPPWHGVVVNPPYAGQFWFCSKQTTQMASPWNTDYLIAVLGWIDATGYGRPVVCADLARFRIGMCLHAPTDGTAFPYDCSVATADGWMFDGKDWPTFFEKTYEERKGQDWSWRGGYAIFARAALMAAKHAGADNADEALAKLNAAIGSYPFERSQTQWALA